MVNRKLNPVRSYFVYDASNNTSTCLVDRCGCALSGSHASNLERHVKRHHKDAHQKLLSEKKGYGESLERPVAKRIKLSEVKIVSNVPVYSAPACTSVNATEDTDTNSLLSACTEMVVKNGRGIDLIDDSGFRKIVEPLLKGSGSNLTQLNSRILSDHIRGLAQTLRNKIKREVAGKVMCLKFDIVTYATCSAIGVNVQFVSNGRIVLRSLAVQKFSQLQSSAYLQYLLMEILETYGITANQVFGVTTDNIASLPTCDVTDSVSAFSNNNDFNVPAACDEVSGDELSVLSAYKRSTSLPAASNPLPNPLHSLQGVPCVSLQLRSAVDLALSEKFVQKVLQKARVVCSHLQEETGAEANEGTDIPNLDSPSNWKSSLQMLQKLLALRSLCDDVSRGIHDTALGPDNWNVIEEVTSTLLRIAEIANSLQYDQRTLGDFYGSLLKFKLQMARLPTTLFGEVIVSAVEEKEKALLDNDVFVSCIYLDPRYKLLLDESQRKRAQDHLLKTWSMIGFSRTDFESSDLKVMTTSEDDLDKLLKEKESEYAKLKATSEVLPERVKTLLAAFVDEERLPKDGNVLKYWDQESTSKPELYELAKVVLAVPATEASLIMTTAALELSQPDQNTKKSNEIIEDILLLRVNDYVSA